jgi:plasmid stabilization system protein ParE
MVGRRRRVVWTESARGALHEILTYIEQDSPDAARRVVERLIETTATLDTLSDRGRIVPELQDPALRELLVQSYRVIYEVSADEVRIVALIHQARDFPPLR